jgi:hypothetical protein
VKLSASTTERHTSKNRANRAFWPATHAKSGTYLQQCAEHGRKEHGTNFRRILREKSGVQFGRKPLEQSVAGDIVTAQFTVEGTNDGPLGSLQPTERKMSVAFCEIERFDKRGRIVLGSCHSRPVHAACPAWARTAARCRSLSQARQHRDQPSSKKTRGTRLFCPSIAQHP